MRRPTQHHGPSELFIVAVLIILTVMGGAVALGGGLINVRAPASAGPGQGSTIVRCLTLPRLATDVRGRSEPEAASPGEDN